MRDVDLLVFGSGSLTSALVLALATWRGGQMSIALAGRNSEALSELTVLAAARSAALDVRLTQYVIHCDYSEQSLSDVFNKVRPRVVLVLASKQSPWKMSSRWGALVSAAGYGITLPLQAVLADRVIREANRRCPNSVCLNGCYPDVSNHVLKERGLQVAGGIGNIAIIDALLRHVHPGRRVQLIAHHAHVAALIRGDWRGMEPPSVWLDDVAQDPLESSKMCQQMTLPASDALNQVTGAAAIPMLRALAGCGEPWVGHAPGIDGLIGGSPARASYGTLQAMMPPGISPDRLNSINQSACRFDGLSVQGDRYSLAVDAKDLEQRFGLPLPDSVIHWRAESLEEQAERLENLRASAERLC